ALVEPAFGDLSRDALRHRTRGNVPGDHGTGARVRLVADLDRRDEDGVGRDPSVLPDLGPVLLPPVVVGGDRPRADVGAVADLGVADVREGWNLRPLTDLRVLDLDERADVGAGSEAGAGPEANVRPHGGVVADLGLVGDRLAHHRTLADDRVRQLRVGTDDRPGADDRPPGEHRAGEQLDVGLELDGGVDVRALGIRHRDAVAHPSLVDTTTQRRFDGGGLLAIVDAGGLVRFLG